MVSGNAAASKKIESNIIQTPHIRVLYSLTNSQKRYMVWKRIIGILLSAAFLVLSLPITLILAVLIKLDSPGPVFFKQKRVGRNGKTIRIYKFRTMLTQAPSNRATANLHDADKYITRVGKFLRKTSMDELPQLINVLRGDMSMIGPRPLILSETDIHEMRNENGVYALRPGLTGLAQVNGRDMVTPQEKVRFDTEYLHCFSFSYDMKIFLKTIQKVFKRDGVVEGCEQMDEQDDSIPKISMELQEPQQHSYDPSRVSE